MIQLKVWYKNLRGWVNLDIFQGEIILEIYNLFMFGGEWCSMTKFSSSVLENQLITSKSKEI